MIYFACYHNMVLFIYRYTALATISWCIYKIAQSEYEITAPWVILHDGDDDKKTLHLSYSSRVCHARLRTGPKYETN